MRPALWAPAIVATLAAACSVSAGLDGRTPQGGSPPASGAVSPSPTGEPVFQLTRIRGSLRERVVGRNWHPGCPVPLDGLRALTVAYWGFDGQVHEGPLVVNERVAEDVLWAFRRLFRAGFPIKRIELARRYRPNADYWDSKRDVTSAFNCRPVTERPGVWSQHAYGLAVDINPLQNPYVRGDGSVLRKAAKPYRDRSLHLPGMIHPGGAVVRAFARIGWGWGGDWTTIRDYMHFSATGK